MLELTYERVYSGRTRFDIKVGTMRVGELRILPFYGEKNSVAAYRAIISWALHLHFTHEEVAFITKSINDDATMRNVTLRMTS